MYRTKSIQEDEMFPINYLSEVKEAFYVCLGRLFWTFFVWCFEVTYLTPKQNSPNREREWTKLQYTRSLKNF